jgi:acyl-CoA thioesterase
VLFTLADQALAVAANSRGYKAFALEVKINYFQAAHAGSTIVAEATPLDVRKRVSLWNIELRNDKHEKIALAQGLAYHFVSQKD